MRAIVALPLLLVLLLTACNGDSAPSGEAPGATEGTMTTPGTPPEPAELARQHLAGRLRTSVGAIEIVSFEAREWPDSCLGLSIPDVVCAPVITPGYRVILRAEGRDHAYRTDRMLNVRPEKSPGTATPSPPGAGVEAARTDLARRLNVAVSSIEVVSVEATEWPDSCLGYGRPDEACLAVITPGQRALLRDGASGQTYEYRLDQQDNYRARP